MNPPVRDRNAMIAGMSPVRRDGVFHFCSMPEAVNPEVLAIAIGTFREDEGLSLILPETAALEQGVTTNQPMACITLNVFSALDGVGLTAAVAQVLADAGIPCNMVAAFHHDHAFVPIAMADKAVALLINLARGTGSGSEPTR
ncbi:MAG: ACT domain-containing protein [Rhodobacterales bacterium]|jgi:uncharacterized protein|nr:ACT domain-containing protein [Pseudomonadota bacterium]MDA1285771.1 ACT domain-containing protein [Pseudomonadota bacterium]